MTGPAELSRLTEAFAGRYRVERELGRGGMAAVYRRRYVSPYHLAYLHTGLSDHDRALDLLFRASEERSGGVYGVKGSFLFTPLHAHPRFPALLHRLNLA